MIERLNAALEGRYRIERVLGEGGMARVYVAEDLKHHRKVAVKVLRPELSAVVGAKRFLTEIETTANLQHPYILPLFDSGEADSFLFYVMPYVVGESLREKLHREKQLRVDESLALAKKVADALHYAHEKGVVHRDIKPANILLSERGEPLVADFGIALAVSHAGGERITETGLSLGTPLYMSPEQATGNRDVDPRSDIYALGCVLYEMLAGEPPFTAPTAHAVLAQILAQEPRRVTELRRAVPAHVDAAIAKSLEKLPADRFASAEAFAAALDDPSFEYRPVRQAASSGSPSGHTSERGATGISARGAIIAAATVVGLVIFAFLAGSSAEGPPTATEAAGLLPTHRFMVADSGEFRPDIYGGVAVAPDGTVAFVRGVGAARRIMVRSPREHQARVLDGTTGGFEPSFSPDGEWIVFSTESELRKVPTRGGPVVTLARTEYSLFHAPHWGPDGVIAVSKQDGLYRVPEAGGTPVKVYESAAPWGAVSAFILPEGRGWLFAQATDAGSRNILLLDPETGETELVMEDGNSPIWVPTGHLAFVHSSGGLFAAPFDLERGVFASQPTLVVDSVRYSDEVSTFAVSSGGAAAYVIGASGVAGGLGAEIVFRGVSGGETRRPPLEPTDQLGGRFSPDGEKLAYNRGDQIWIYDLELGSHTRLAAEDSNHVNAVWSPDGTKIAFSSRGNTDRDIWVKEVEGDSPARPLLEMEGNQHPMEWTDEGVLVIQTYHAGSSDIYMMPADGSGSPQPYLRADWDEWFTRLSPDGRWLAYVSGQRDNDAVVVRSFPQPGRAFLVSDPAVRSSEPQWSPDGSVLYYRQPYSHEIIAAEVRTEPDFEVVNRRTVGTGVDRGIRDIHPNGQWLLAFQKPKIATEEQAHSRLIVVVNWFSELLERMGETR